MSFAAFGLRVGGEEVESVAVSNDFVHVYLMFGKMIQHNKCLNICGSTTHFLETLI